MVPYVGETLVSYDTANEALTSDVTMTYAFVCVCCSPSLTWRDMQYLVVRTANTRPFLDAQWVTNGVGRKGEQLRAIYT